MQKIIVLISCLAFSYSAHAAKACEELKTEIAAKIEAKGIKAYSLEIIDKDQATKARVVGQCDGGKHKIIYTKQ